MVSPLVVQSNQIILPLDLTFQPKVRANIVLLVQLEKKLASVALRQGTSVNPTATITVTTTATVAGLDVDTPFRITGVTASGYSGQFVVAEKVDSTNIKYQVQNAPSCCTSYCNWFQTYIIL